MLAAALYLIALYLLLRFALSMYIIVDQHTGVIAALKRSWEYTQGWKAVIALLLLYMLIGVPGALLSLAADKLFVPTSNAYLIAEIVIALINVIVILAFGFARIKLYRLLQDKTLPTSRFSF